VYQNAPTPQWQEPSYTPPPVQQSWQNNQPAPNGTQTHDEILATLERLSDLHKKGILSEDEFRTKKADLLSRL
jgi:hypothetical protein